MDETFVDEDAVSAGGPAPDEELAAEAAVPPRVLLGQEGGLKGRLVRYIVFSGMVFFTLLSFWIPSAYGHVDFYLNRPVLVHHEQDEFIIKTISPADEFDGLYLYRYALSENFGLAMLSEDRAKAQKLQLGLGTGNTPVGLYGFYSVGFFDGLDHRMWCREHVDGHFGGLQTVHFVRKWRKPTHHDAFFFQNDELMWTNDVDPDAPQYWAGWKACKSRYDEPGSGQSAIELLYYPMGYPSLRIPDECATVILKRVRVKDMHGPATPPRNSTKAGHTTTVTKTVTNNCPSGGATGRPGHQDHHDHQDPATGAQQHTDTATGRPGHVQGELVDTDPGRPGQPQHVIVQHEDPTGESDHVHREHVGFPWHWFGMGDDTA